MPESTGLHTCGCWSINAVVTMLSVIVKAVLHPTQSFEERLSSLPSGRIKVNPHQETASFGLIFLIQRAPI